MNNLSAFTKSLIFHVVVVLFVSGAFLFKDKTLTVTETPIEVAFVTDVPASAEREKKPEPIEETPPPIEDKPQPAPKALEQPKPKPKVEEKADKAEDKPVEKVEAKPLKEPDPEPKPVAKPPEKKPESKPEPKEKPKDPAEKETTTDFMSVLKNLQDSEPVSTNRDGPKLTEAPVGQAVTSGEINALTKQLAGCWSLLPGAAQAETLAVTLTITVNQDRTVRNVTIDDKARYQSDPFFRAAADNAMRAIKHPNCTPLDLPPEKYNMWKEMTLNFDPKRMF